MAAGDGRNESVTNEELGGGVDLVQLQLNDLYEADLKGVFSSKFELQLKCILDARPDAQVLSAEVRRALSTFKVIKFLLLTIVATNTSFGSVNV